MNILLYTQSTYILDSFIDFLIPLGVTLYSTEHDGEITVKIQNNKIDLVLIDLNRETYERSLKTIQRIRNSPIEKMKKCAIVLFVEGLGKELIAKALSSGAVGYIELAMAPDKIFDTFAIACKRMSGVDIPRNYVKLVLNSERTPENIAVKFNSKLSGQSVLGIAKSLSIVGFVLAIKGTTDVTSITRGMEIDGMKFLLLGKEIIIDGIVALFQSGTATILFNNMSKENRHDLSQYIYRKLAGLV